MGTQPRPAALPARAWVTPPRTAAAAAAPPVARAASAAVVAVAPPLARPVDPIVEAAQRHTDQLRAALAADPGPAATRRTGDGSSSSTNQPSTDVSLGSSHLTPPWRVAARAPAGATAAPPTQPSFSPSPPPLFPNARVPLASDAASAPAPAPAAAAPPGVWVPSQADARETPAVAAVSPTDDVISLAAVRALVHNELLALRVSLHQEIQNLHVDMLRQFQLQRVGGGCVHSPCV
jgi:hypothetical protein